jgi:hypothetical protein
VHPDQADELVAAVDGNDPVVVRAAGAIDEQGLDIGLHLLEHGVPRDDLVPRVELEQRLRRPGRRRVERDDSIRRDVIMRMMCQGRIDKAAVERAWGLAFDETFRTEIADLETPERDGLVVRSAAAIEATPLGHLFLRNLALPFDRYLREREKAPGGVSRTFSRTH